MAVLTKISSPPLQTLQRHFSRQNLSPLVTFTTNQDIPKSSEFTLSNFQNDGRRPLAVIFPWLLAKPKSVQRFTQFYLSQNFDVLTLRSTTPSQFLSPLQYDRIIETEIVPALLSSTNHQIKLIHGFSVGGYVFSRTLKQIREAGEDGNKFINSIRAQVWDSVADWTKVGRATANAALPLSSPEVFRKAILTASDIYMKHFLGNRTKYYQEGQQNFLHNPVKASALFLVSEADNFVSVPALKECRELWENAGITTQFKLWTEDEEVGHLQGIRKYPNEYISMLTRFLNRNGFTVEMESSSVSHSCPNYLEDPIISKL